MIKFIGFTCGTRRKVVSFSSEVNLYIKQISGFQVFCNHYLGLSLQDHECSTSTVSMQSCSVDWNKKSLTESVRLLDKPGIYVDKSIFAILLRRCKAAKALSDGICVHNHIVKDGYISDNLICNLLLQMYCSCGAVENALGMFEIVSECDPLSWSAIIRLHTFHGNPCRARQYFVQLLMESTMPDKTILSSILSACASLSDMAEGKRLHASMMITEFSNDIIVLTSLINMYIRCCNLYDACCIFNGISGRDAALWDVMISAYAKNGFVKDAISMFIQMQEERGMPNSSTVINVLCACAKEALLIDARNIHSLMMHNNIEINNNVAACLVSTYSKCGNIDDAQNIFDQICDKRHSDSWHALITGYIDNGLPEDALVKFNQMQDARIPINECTFVSMLGLCLDQYSLPMGERIHGSIIARGLESSTSVRVSLLDMYGRCGSIENAVKLIRKYPIQDTLTWNAVLDLYSKFDQGNNCFQFFQRMQGECCIPDKTTCVCVLDACTTWRDLPIGRQIHAQTIGNTHLLDNEVETTLVEMYGRCSTLEDSLQAFETASKNATSTWNSALALCSGSNCGLLLFDNMLQMGSIPDSLTYVGVIKLCRTLTNLQRGKQIHACIIAGRFENDIVGSALMSMYGYKPSIAAVESVFYGIPQEDVVSWCTLMSIYSEQGWGKQCIFRYGLMLEEGVMPNKDVHTILLNACAIQSDTTQGKRVHVRLSVADCKSDIDVGNALINMYAKCGHLEDARRTLDKMRQYNRETFIDLLKACGEQGALTEGRRIHARIKGSSLKSDVALGTALLNMYADCGHPDSAREIFDKLSETNLECWNAMISAYGRHDNGREAVSLFVQMQEKGIRPDSVTFQNLLMACANSSLLEIARDLFHAMKSDYGITAEADHYSSLVKVYASAGELDKAVEMLDNMPCKANHMALMGLLHSCLEHVDVYQCECITEQAIRRDPDNVMPYVILASTYAAAGMENNVINVITRIKNMSKRKEQGFTLIEVNGKVHKFLLNDTSHPKKEKIYAEVERLRKSLRSEENIADSKIILHGVEEEHDFCNHSEELALAFGLLSTLPRTPIFLAKNLRVCPDCHSLCKYISKSMERDIIVRDPYYFHKIKNGICSCREY